MSRGEPVLDRVVRLTLLLLGASAVGVAALGLSSSSGWIDVSEPGELYRRIVPSAGLSGGASALVVGLVAVGFGAAWARWLWSTVRANRANLVVDDGEMGTVVVRSDALCRAVAADLERIPDVVDARVRLERAGRHPRIRAVVAAQGRADLAGLGERITEALCRAACALGEVRLRAWVDIELNDVTRSSLRISRASSLTASALSHGPRRVA